MLIEVLSSVNVPMRPPTEMVVEVDESVPSKRQFCIITPLAVPMIPPTASEAVLKVMVPLNAYPLKSDKF